MKIEKLNLEQELNRLAIERVMRWILVFDEIYDDPVYSDKEVLHVFFCPKTLRERGAYYYEPHCGWVQTFKPASKDSDMFEMLERCISYEIRKTTTGVKTIRVLTKGKGIEWSKIYWHKNIRYAAVMAVLDANGIEIEVV